MAINNIYPLGLRRLYLYTLTDDTAGSPVYGTGVRVNCTRTLTWAPNQTEIKLEGDDVICRSTAMIDSIKVDIEFGGAPLDLWAKLLGASTQDSAISSNDSTILDLAVSDQRPELGWIALAYGDKAGAHKVIGYRAVATNGPGGSMAKGAYRISVFTLDSKTAPYDGDRLLRAINYEVDTDATISTTWTANPVWP